MDCEKGKGIERSVCLPDQKAENFLYNELNDAGAALCVLLFCIGLFGSVRD